MRTKTIKKEKERGMRGEEWAQHITCESRVKIVIFDGMGSRQAEGREYEKGTTHRREREGEASTSWCLFFKPKRKPKPTLITFAVLSATCRTFPLVSPIRHSLSFFYFLFFFNFHLLLICWNYLFICYSASVNYSFRPIY